MIVRAAFAAVLLSTSLVFPASAEPLQLGPFEPYAQGPYHAYAGMWALEQDDTLALGHKAVEGVDYDATITLDKTTFPNQTAINWLVPPDLLKLTGVYGYLQLAYGNYHGSRVPEPVQPSQVEAIDRLDVSLSYSFEGNDRFNILNELYLLADPSDVESVLFEVGIFARSSDEMVRFFEDGEQIGTFVDEHGRNWQVAKRDSPQGGDFIMLVPVNREDVQGDFDWVQIFSYLQEQGILRGDEWFTGIAVGVEPVAGAGQVHIEAFNVDYLPES